MTERNFTAHVEDMNPLGLIVIVLDGIMMEVGGERKMINRLWNPDC